MARHLDSTERARIADMLRQGLSVGEIFRQTGFSRDTIRLVRDREGIPAHARGDWRATAALFEPYRHRQTFDAEGNLKSESVALKPPAGEPFEPPPGHMVAGVSALLDSEGRTVQQWVKTRAGATDPLEIANAVREVFADAPLPALPYAPAETQAGLLTVYPLPDLHLGMLAWGRETGEPYDLTIAQRDICAAVDELVSCSPPAEHAVILSLGDLFHQNDQSNRTPRSGHQLDVDGRYAKVLRVGVSVIRRIIDRALERHASVTFRALPGNHDPEASLALTVALACLYEGSHRVTVDDDPSPHWYHRHGAVLLGGTHGHTMKPDKMAMMLAADRPEDWGATKFRHVFFGHVHHESAREVGAVRVESFNSPAARDAFATAGGWRAGRALQAITFCADRGERHRHRVPL